MAIAAAGAQATRMRALAIGAALAACGQPEAAPPVHRPAAPAGAVGMAAGSAAPAPPAAIAAPTLRLPDGVAPVAYDLTLELDPERASFTG
ncbi:MAG TPA: hypothetical protein VK607_21095, partial [Kofleriaceae bacterium]|nr:hypothetical protein [Kofleriaceae bacterium]